MNLGCEEHIYKYYIHHGVSVYLVASRDLVNPELWQVSVKNLYSPGKDLGFGSCPNVCNNCYSLGCRNNYCICAKAIPGRPPVCKPNQIKQPIPGINTGIDRSSNIKMTTSELERLMRRLDTSNGIDLKQGNIILY
jgi:hypothetical protein